VELTAGLFRNGVGARIAGNYQSGTTVRGPDLGDDLRFGDFATANLRLFADLNAQRALIRRAPWLRGTRVSLNVDNLFNSRLDVRDEAGLVPLGYQPGLLDPLGRSVTLSIRKLFF
jgi:outer membrane receptor protein involved in Fe transport